MHGGAGLPCTGGLTALGLPCSAGESEADGHPGTRWRAARGSRRQQPGRVSDRLIARARAVAAVAPPPHPASPASAGSRSVPSPASCHSCPLFPPTTLPGITRSPSRNRVHLPGAVRSCRTLNYVKSRLDNGISLAKYRRRRSAASMHMVLHAPTALAVASRFPKPTVMINSDGHLNPVLIGRALRNSTFDILWPTHAPSSTLLYHPHALESSLYLSIRAARVLPHATLPKTSE